MNAEELDQLFARYVKGHCTPEENQQVEDLIEAYDNKSTAWKDLPEAGQKAWLSNLWTDVQSTVSNYESKVFALRNRFKISKMAIAAAVALMIFGAGLFYFNNTNRMDADKIVYKDDVMPGKNRAVLTLANGQVLTLSGAKTGLIINANKLTYNDGSSLIGGKVVYNEVLLSTPRGGTYQVTLSDGTKVWLNAASSIKFPNTFAGLKSRSVEIEGEAYFEVSKDKSHPFLVKSGRQEVKVLGTHFNISSYADEATIKTTLLEGSVKVSSLLDTGGGETILKPNQQANLSKNGTIKVVPADEDAVSWKSGKFRFNNTSLEDILRQLARWYNVDIKYVGGVPNEQFTGGIDKNLTASEALSLFKYMKVNFKIEGRTIIVSK